MSATGNEVEFGELQNNNNQTVPDEVMPDIPVAFDADVTALSVYEPVMPETSPLPPSVPAVDAGVSGGEQVKRKRGRPRKYPSGGTHGLASPSQPPPPPPPQYQTDVGATEISSPAAMAADVASSSTAGKKKIGRPPGSSRKRQTVGTVSTGVRFMAHVITVQAGEDVASSIKSYFQDGTQAICIMSANGAISRVTLAQPASAAGVVTYEGRFEILSLAGSFNLTELDAQRTRAGLLSVSLSGPDGRVLGGSVSGLLIAATPLQLVVGCFVDAVKSSGTQNQTTEA